MKVEANPQCREPLHRMLLVVIKNSQPNRNIRRSNLMQDSSELARDAISSASLRTLRRLLLNASCLLPNCLFASPLLGGRAGPSLDRVE